jgi:hypothetical protein
MRTNEHLSQELLTMLSRELIGIAKNEDDLAAHEASRTPYWAPTPPTVDGHRAAARALRRHAELFETAARERETAEARQTDLIRC